MKFAISLLKNLTFLFVALVILIGVASSASQPAGPIIILAFLAVGVISLFRPLRQIGITSRITAVVLIVLTLMSAVFLESQMSKIELAGLRSSDPETYLLRIRKDKALYRRELKELFKAQNTVQYLELLKAFSDEEFLAELREIDSKAYAQEIARRDAVAQEERRIALEEQRVALERRKIDEAEELTKLKERVAVGGLDDKERMRVYSRLAVLQPENKSYAAEAKKITAEVQAREAKDWALSEARAHPERAIDMTFTWTKPLDSIMVATFTLKNKAPIPIRDIGVSCKMIAGSDTVLGKAVKVITERIEPGKTKTVRDLNFGFISQQTRSFHVS